MKTKLIILLILFLIPAAATGATLEFTRVENEISRLCGLMMGGFVNREPGPKSSFEFLTLANLSEKINAAYPGSTLNCNTGSGIFALNMQKYYFDNRKVIRMTETGANSLDYETSEYGRYWKVSDGKNYIKVEVDRGLFIDVHLPILAETANMIGKTQVVSFRQNELMNLLNEFYAKNKQLGKIHEFANSLLLDPSFRETFLTWSEGYLNNSTPEQNKVTATTNTTKNNEIKKAPKGKKTKVTPEETAKCILELRIALQEARLKVGVYDQSKKDIPDAEMEKAINKVADEIEKSPCGPVLHAADEYIDKDMEFTRQVDAILAKGKK